MNSRLTGARQTPTAAGFVRAHHGGAVFPHGEREQDACPPARRIWPRGPEGAVDSVRCCEWRGVEIKTIAVRTSEVITLLTRRVVRAHATERLFSKRRKGARRTPVGVANLAGRAR